jgi:hypothetical protein
MSSKHLDRYWKVEVPPTRSDDAGGCCGRDDEAVHRQQHDAAAEPTAPRLREPVQSQESSRHIVHVEFTEKCIGQERQPSHKEGAKAADDQQQIENLLGQYSRQHQSPRFPQRASLPGRAGWARAKDTA